MHSFQNQNTRTFEVFIRNLHLASSSEIDLLKTEIKSRGHKYETLNKENNIVFSERKNNNGDIYKIGLMNRTRVRTIIEAKRSIKNLPQCVRYQRYGHTKSYCNRPLQCAKCARDHLSKNCEWTSKIIKWVKCVLCVNKKHSANYKGC